MAINFHLNVLIVHLDEKKKRKSIFCLDLHPNAPLLATGGIGKDELKYYFCFLNGKGCY